MSTEIASRDAVTKSAAKTFGDIAGKLRSAGHDPLVIARFLNRVAFCFFVRDIGLIPGQLFSDILNASARDPDGFEDRLGALFRVMRQGGSFGTMEVPWFNGGLFDDDQVAPLGSLEIQDLIEAAKLDWRGIDPSIFGTLFQAALDPQKREAMASLFDPRRSPPKARAHQDTAGRGVGIHYTDATTIQKIVEPVVIQPLQREWDDVKTDIIRLRDEGKSDLSRKTWASFRDRIGKFRVLDPACGSGNFLYISLLLLKDFDLSVIREGIELGFEEDAQRVGPQAVLGIEINPYAADLARTTIWIGELQWQHVNGFPIKRVPILGRLDGIECRDALLAPDWKEADWPEADVVVGNPPFMGGKRLRRHLGDEYVARLFSAYAGRVPAEADLVAYWFAKSWDFVEAGKIAACGFVSTNSIRNGSNRAVLETIARRGKIFNAWSDEEWVEDGASVNVSLTCFGGSRSSGQSLLNGKQVDRINADLTGTDANTTTARCLTTNRGFAFMGDTKGGSFVIDGSLAREWLRMPLNANGRPNSDVLRPWINGLDIARRPSDKWIIDFGIDMSEEEASAFEAPFAHVRRAVKPERDNNRREQYKNFWWRHAEPRPGMWHALAGKRRYIGTARVAKHRIFSWIEMPTVPDSQVIVIARDDDVTFGILQSRFHEVWSLKLGSSLEDRPRYTPSTTFDTFPFPDNMGPEIAPDQHSEDPLARAIAEAAKRLDELRRAWLYPEGLVVRVPEVVAGFPDRLIPKDDRAAKELSKRTLTQLYNDSPSWLQDAHRALDEAVAKAYGWPADIKEEDVVAKLLNVNSDRSKSEVSKIFLDSRTFIPAQANDLDVTEWVCLGEVKVRFNDDIAWSTASHRVKRSEFLKRIGDSFVDQLGKAILDKYNVDIRIEPTTIENGSALADKIKIFTSTRAFAIYGTIGAAIAGYPTFKEGLNAIVDDIGSLAKAVAEQFSSAQQMTIEQEGFAPRQIDLIHQDLLNFGVNTAWLEDRPPEEHQVVVG